MKQWTIRNAEVKDSKGLRDCMHLAYAKYLDRMAASDLPPMGVDYEEEIKNYPVWVIEDADEIVAGIVLVFEKEYASIANIAVRPDRQGTGLGKLLIQFAENEAMKKGYKELHLTTHHLLKENIAFYKKLGYIHAGSEVGKIYMKKSV